MEKRLISFQLLLDTCKWFSCFNLVLYSAVNYGFMAKRHLFCLICFQFQFFFYIFSSHFNPLILKSYEMFYLIHNIVEILMGNFGRSNISKLYDTQVCIRELLNKKFSDRTLIHIRYFYSKHFFMLLLRGI